MTKKLTLKQEQFAHKYIQNGGNATKAALETYDTNDYNTGSQLGHKNLRLPAVRSLVQNKFKKKELTTEYVLSHLKSDIEYCDAPNPYRTRALEMIAKYLKMFDEKDEPSYNERKLQAHRIEMLESVAKMLRDKENSGKPVILCEKIE